MPLPQQLCIIAAGLFFLTGLVCGAWKYKHISGTSAAQASTYVDIAHRAALMYAFSCLVLERMVTISQLEPTLELCCVLVLLFYFGVAQCSYILHGVLRDTDNQFKRPHRLGKVQLPSSVVTIFMISLIFFELCAFATLMSGAVDALVFGPPSPSNRDATIPDYSSNPSRGFSPVTGGPNPPQNLTPH